MAIRTRGLVTLIVGLVVVAAQVLLIVGGIVDSEDSAARVVVVGFIAGGALAVKGGIEWVVGEPFQDVVREHKTVLQWLAFLALVLVAVGIVLATT